MAFSRADTGHCRGCPAAGFGNIIAVTTGRRRQTDAAHSIRSGRGHAPEGASAAVKCCGSAIAAVARPHAISATRTASGATQPWIASVRPQPARKVVARASTHRYPQTVVAQRADVYPHGGPGAYEGAYPPAPWQVPRYAYYYPPYGYYPRYSYYYYPR